MNFVITGSRSPSAKALALASLSQPEGRDQRNAVVVDDMA
jgi:hypothetical protein